jgi:LacI family transcriptional regulator
MSPTIRDVALSAGVSVKTVSRVLNHEPGVNETTEARVQAAMAELGYAPNISAQRLASGRSRALGLVFSNATSTYILDVLIGMVEEARAAGYGVVSHPCNLDCCGEHQEILTLVTGRRVDGLVFTPPSDCAPGIIEELIGRGTPVVCLTPSEPAPPTPSVRGDDLGGARALTELLIGYGHTRIGHIKGHPDHQASEDRVRGYIAALASAGLAAEPGLIRQGDWSFASGLAEGGALLDLRPPPTAIFAGNDDMAAGVLHAAYLRGLAVPDGLSVAGFDDAPSAIQAWPPLTTVRQPVREIARLAARLLIETLDGQPAVVTRHVLPTEVVIRQSVASPAAVAVAAHTRRSGAAG